jgi:uncharacterized membrane protein (DUF373 family)
VPAARAGKRIMESIGKRNGGRFDRERFVWLFELVTVTALQILIMAVVFVATFILFVMFVHNVYARTNEIQSIDVLLPAMQKVFAGVLVVLLGLELAETMKTYFTKHHIRVEVILILAIVGVGRHMIQLDFDHIPAAEILSLAALMLALTGGYFLVKKAQAQLPTVTTDSASLHSGQLMK